MSIALESQSERIRSKMASLRRHMHKDAKRIVANTNSLLDWKDHVRQFPKSLVAAGLVAGFVIGPGRKIVSSVKLSQESIDELLAQRKRQVAIEEGPRRSEIASLAVRTLSGLALSGATILLRKVFENYFSGELKTGATGRDHHRRSN